ncbi:MAG: AEC family transporter [Bacteroidales bacterium]|nr:AEC family transporter [Bacteroidales bacterium]
MNSIFLEAFSGMFGAIIKIFLVAIIAGFLVKRNIIKQEYIKGLSEVTVKVFLPALVFDKVTTTFDPLNTSGWWVLPLLGMLTPLIFIGITSIFYLPKIKDNLNKIPLAAFQNAGYLVLPIGQILYSSTFDKFALYVFLYVLGFNLILWSVGKYLITKTKDDKKIKFLDLLTPPLLANLLALFLVFTKLNSYVPKIIAQPVSMLGSAAVPVGIFILGATLGAISFKQMPKFSDLLKISFVKYFISPAIVILFLINSHIPQNNPLLADFLVIEASAAPAANLIVMVRKYGGNAQQTGSIMFVMYMFAILMMPLTIALWKIILVSF